MDRRKLEVVDYSFGKRYSKRVDTSIPFTDNYKEQRTLQGANVVIAGYVDKNNKDINAMNIKLNGIDTNINEIFNDLETIDTTIDTMQNDITDLTTEINNISGELLNKQDTLISGETIKTINGESLLGSGDIEVATETVWGDITGTLDNQTDLMERLAELPQFSDIPTRTEQLVNDSGFVSSSEIKTVNNQTLIGYGNVQIDVPTKTSDLTNDSDYINSSYHDSAKQDTLVSGTNIKTINNESLLGGGNIEVATETAWGDITGTLSNQTDLQTALDSKANTSDIDNNIYSTSEVKIGKWINGKPVYRQVIQSSTGNTGQEKTIRNIPNFGIMVDIYGSIYWNANLKVGVSTAIGTGNIAAAYVDGGNVIVYVTSGNLANKTCYITVEYTKTND